MNSENINGASTKTTWERMRGCLSRVTTSGRYIPVIDGLRFVAITSVLLFHVQDSLIANLPQLEAPARQTWLFHLLKVGNIGVPLFFTISGFILTLPFLESISSGQKLPLRRYFLRRITRLEPPYIVNLLLITLLLIVVRGDSPQELLAPLAASLGYVHNLIYGQMSRINPVTWSLEIEVQFYLLAPLLAWGILRSSVAMRRAILLVLVVASCLIKSVAVGPLPSRLLMSLPWHLDHFLVGMLLADVYVTDWKQKPALSMRWDAIGLCAWGLLIASQMSSTMRHWMPLMTAAAYVGTFRGQLLSWFLSRPAITITGGMCYSLYLYHFYVVSFVSKFTIPHMEEMSYLTALLCQLAVIVPLTWLLGAALFVGIERPFMIWQPWARGDKRASEGQSPPLAEGRVAAS